MNIPRELQDLDQWVVWKYGKPDRNGKLSKPPYNAKTHHHGKSNDPRTWTDFLAAKWAASNGHQYKGVGFAFKEGDGIAGLDIDYPYDSPEAKEVIEHFKGTYCERSPSGHLRIFCYGKPRRTGKGTQDKHYEVYDYTSPRYLTVTDDWIEGTAKEVTEQQEALDWLYESYFKPKEKPQQKSNGAASPSGGMSDDEILNKLFEASNGARARMLFDGDWDQAGYPSQSEGDAALCSMLGFYTQDEEQIDRLFRASKLWRDKWDKVHGSDGRTYGKRTIDFALSNLGETYSGKKKDKATTARLDILLGELADLEHFKYNLFSQRVEVQGEELKSDSQITEYRDLFLQTKNISVGHVLMYQGIECVARRNAYDPVVDYLESLTWDGIMRLTSWLSDVYSAEQSEYAAAVGERMLTSAVARAYKPGCKVRTMVLFTGIQELGKSKSCADLCPNPDWFSDSLPKDLHTREAAEALAGKWIVESAELASFRRSETEAIKAFLSRNIDNYRAPYARVTESRPRRCILVGTANNNTPIPYDEEGTRYWPVAVKDYNEDFLSLNRDQLWAEAVHIFKTGKSWWLNTPDLKKLAAEVREEFRGDDALVENLRAQPLGRSITVHEVIGIIQGRLNDRALEMRIGAALRTLGYIRRRKHKGWAYELPD